MNFEQCQKIGLIKKSQNAQERTAQSLELADKFLKSAKNNFKIGEYEVCELISYNALFHYARALLFSKGYIERSHACLFEALVYLYPDSKEIIQKADKLRLERHNLQYSGIFSGKPAAEYACEFTQEFGIFAKRQLDKR